MPIMLTPAESFGGYLFMWLVVGIWVVHMTEKENRELRIKYPTGYTYKDEYSCPPGWVPSPVNFGLFAGMIWPATLLVWAGVAVYWAITQWFTRAAQVWAALADR